jgi:hypothetical protein
MLDLISCDNGKLTIDLQNLISVSGETVFRQSSERPNELQSEAEVAASSEHWGDRFTGVPVTEIRGAILRPFLENRMSIAANFLIANGFTGQTTETLALPTEPASFERLVGVPLKSYASLSWTYYCKR